MDIITKLQIIALIIGSFAFSTCLKDNSRNKKTEIPEISINQISSGEKDSVLVSVKVVTRNVKSVMLFLGIEPDKLDSVNLIPNQALDTFSVLLPPQDIENEVDYYIVFEDFNGKKLYKPQGAPVVKAKLFSNKESD